MSELYRPAGSRALEVLSLVRGDPYYTTAAPRREPA